MIPENPFVLFELVNNELIKGVRYYIKDYYTINKKYTEIYATVIEYVDEHIDGDRSVGLFRAHAYYSFYQNLDQTIIYRRISKEEYYEKVKEKYDRKCLDIILKRLLDESFAW